MSFAVSGSPSNARSIETLPIESSTAVFYFRAPPLALIFISSFILSFASLRSLFSSAFLSAVSFLSESEF